MVLTPESLSKPKAKRGTGKKAMAKKAASAAATGKTKPPKGKEASSAPKPVKKPESGIVLPSGKKLVLPTGQTVDYGLIQSKFEELKLTHDDLKAIYEHGRPALARSDYRAFIEHCWLTPSEPFLSGRHTKAITARLQKAIEDFKRGISSYILIVVPHRHGKSDAVSRYFPGWVLGNCPDAEIIMASYAADLIEELSRDARSIVQSAEYQQVFPEIRLSTSSSAVDSWSLQKKRGKVRAMGLLGGVTGKGAHVLLIDDPMKGRKFAESPGQREDAWLAITNDFMSRLAPVHIVIILGTRWHLDDPIGRIIRAKSENPSFPQFDYMHFRAREMGRDGKPRYLFPERYPDSWYETQFAVLKEYGSASLLQGEPIVAGGNMFSIDQIKQVPFDDFPKDLKWVRYWDIAYKEKERIGDDPDWTVGAKVAVDRDKNGVPRCWVADLRMIQANAPARNKLMADTAILDGPSCWVGVEAISGGRDAYNILKEAILGRANVYGVMSKPDKVSDAETLEPVIDAGNFHVCQGASWVQGMIDEFAAFPNGIHDDMVDAIVGGFKLAFQRKDGTRKRFIEKPIPMGGFY